MFCGGATGAAAGAGAPAGAPPWPPLAPLLRLGDRLRSGERELYLRRRRELPSPREAESCGEALAAAAALAAGCAEPAGAGCAAAGSAAGLDGAAPGGLAVMNLRRPSASFAAPARSSQASGAEKAAKRQRREKSCLTSSSAVARQRRRRQRISLRIAVILGAGLRTVTREELAQHGICFHHSGERLRIRLVILHNNVEVGDETAASCARPADVGRAFRRSEKLVEGKCLPASLLGSAAVRRVIVDAVMLTRVKPSATRPGGARPLLTAVPSWLRGSGRGGKGAHSEGMLVLSHSICASGVGAMAASTKLLSAFRQSAWLSRGEKARWLAPRR